MRLAYLQSIRCTVNICLQDLCLRAYIQNYQNSSEGVLHRMVVTSKLFIMCHHRILGKLNMATFIYMMLVDIFFSKSAQIKYMANIKYDANRIGCRL